jgi:hypothetical protein
MNAAVLCELGPADSSGLHCMSERLLCQLNILFLQFQSVRGSLWLGAECLVGGFRFWRRSGPTGKLIGMVFPNSQVSNRA